MVEDVRTYARSMLPSQGSQVGRDQFIRWVREYAASKHGTGEEVILHAERTARHLWDSRRG